MTLEPSLNFKYVFQNSSTGEVHTKVFDLEHIEQEYFQCNNLYENGYELIARCLSINAYDKHKKEIFDGDILKINGSVYVVKIIGSAAALLYPDQDNVYEYFHNLSPNNYVGELIGDIYSMPNLFFLSNQEREMIALRIFKEYKEMDGIVNIPTPQLDEAIKELEEHTKILPLLDFFLPIIFHNHDELHVKAKELDCVPFKGADDIQCLHHIGGTLHKSGCRLFYLKKTFSDKELEHLVYCYDYKVVKDKPNIYINGNHNTGVLYVVENIQRESTK